jgi:hypothetical protein
MTDLLPFGLSLKNSLVAHNTFYSFLIEISDIITKIAEYERLKGNPELILLICRILEVKMAKNDSGIDKKELVVSIYQKVFGAITPEEIAVLKSSVQFLYDNGKIKGASVIKAGIAFVVDYIKKKILCLHCW